jgi:HEAT repeat protein
MTCEGYREGSRCDVIAHAAGGSGDSTGGDCYLLLEAIPGLPQEEQRRAIERLIRDPDPGIRGPALRMGAVLLSDDSVVSQMRDGSDDVIRNAGLEILKLRDHGGLRLAMDLLEDADSDVVLQAIQALEHYGDPRALDPLRRLLAHSNPNVLQAVLLAIGNFGQPEAVQDILPFLGGDSWVRMAAIQALGSVGDSAAIEPLADCLADPALSSLAAVALARIGGPQAFGYLAHRLIDPEGDDAELELLQRVLEGLTERPRHVKGLCEALVARMTTSAAPHNAAAARCVLALGPGYGDDEAARILAQAEAQSREVPDCLMQRPDLIESLLLADDARCGWGFLLAGRYPHAAPVPALCSALVKLKGHEHLDPAYEALSHLPECNVGGALLDFYSRLPQDARTWWGPVLQRHRASLWIALGRRTDVPQDTRRILEAAMAFAPAAAATAITQLPTDLRVEAIALVSDRKPVLRRLPWMEWLGEAPTRYGSLAVKVGEQAGLKRVLPEIRSLLRQEPHSELVRLVAALGDRESVDLLGQLVETGDEDLLPFILRALGELGGPKSRRVLRQFTASDHLQHQRLGYKSLSLCYRKQDLPRFREGVAHDDWYIRLVCTDVLGAVGHEADWMRLSQLAGDPIAVVSERARVWLAK